MMYQHVLKIQWIVYEKENHSVQIVMELFSAKNQS